jgi:hypothetical protein
LDGRPFSTVNHDPELSATAPARRQQRSSVEKLPGSADAKELVQVTFERAFARKMMAVYSTTTYG